MGQLTSESSTDDGVTGRSSEPNLNGVSGINDAPEGGGNGVYGKSGSPKGSGVKGINSDAGVGVWGESTGGVGVRGTSHGKGDGVYGENDYKFPAGAHGAGGGPFAGVKGKAKDFVGVWGESANGVDVRGDSTGSHGVQGGTGDGDASGIYGTNSGKRSDEVLHIGPLKGAGVTGYAIDCAGVVGTSKNDIGVSGTGGLYGGNFDGQMAQIRLIPGPTEGAPKGRHWAGELYLDKAGDLFLCKQSGHPAIWKQIG